jgi:hypothetical protein
MAAEKTPLYPTNRIFDVFGWNGFPDALFYETDFSLRFKLGEDLSEVPARFLQAMDRARYIANALFDRSESLTAVISYFDGERRTPRAAASFKALSKMGFKATFGPAEQTKQNNASYIAKFGGDLCKYWHSAKFSKTPHQVNALLWASITCKMPTMPKIRHLDAIYIIDFPRGIAATLYDDRGMDVIALDRAPLQPLYEQFEEWLWNSDRPKMDRVFSRNF